MIEKVYQFSSPSPERMIERIVDDQNVVLNHMILPPGTEVPKHHANSNVYMIVVKGTLTLTLGDQEPKAYAAGQIVNIPFLTEMHPHNRHEETLEFFVVKAPNPRDMIKDIP